MPYVEVELVVNKESLARLAELGQIARDRTRNSPISVMRLLQIEEHAKEYAGL